MDKSTLYTKGSRVWLPDREEVWKDGVVVAYSPKDNILVSDSSGKEVHFSLKNGDKTPPLRNPEILTMENNLTTMSYLHEPAVLNSLYQRFTRSNSIYTYCGIVLVAINPYCDVPLYGNEMVWAYKGQQIGQLDPHIYAISEDAYSEMKTLGRNQSIIVSGESGAGKTVSAKYAMRYFATVAGNEKETAIERRILSTNPIMEGLGNAKTIRNDNSSRFGKYVELEFDKEQNIVGAHICTYLLEKSRVVFQAKNERNYHVFYQLCAARDIPEMKFLNLRHPDEFKYTRKGRAPVINNVDDTEMFYEMSGAMFNLGITEIQQMFLYSVLAAILHMGNIQFVEERNDSCSIDSNDEHLKSSAKLLGLKVEELEKWLCHKTLKARNETIVKSLKVKDAMSGMEAFVKHIYASLFHWVVKLLNSALSGGKNDTENFIGILDIYGFEMFEQNSFEQFCINYANEKLQQQFNQHVFKLEQAEYIREEIKWSFIDFTDNQPCIDLIERKMGIIDLLDEQCKMNRGTDENWIQILYKEHSDNRHFEKPRTGTDQFVIVHYADKVSYLCHGFIAKNLDSVNDSHIELLMASSFEFVHDVLNAKKDLDKRVAKKLELAGETFGASDPGDISSPKRVAAKSRRNANSGTLTNARTVGGQFKSSLNLLMDALSATVPHFIRCIKPNDEKEPFGFVRPRVVQQLRACGVIETVRISAAGYPSRWSYTEFEHRYSILIHSSKIRQGETLLNCKTVLTAIIQDKDKYQFGKTKIFFRAGQVAYFEKLRSERMFRACVMMQANVRGWLAAKSYRRLISAALTVQCMVRGLLARRRTRAMRENRASVTMQRHVRGWVQRTKYRRVRVVVAFIQCRHRARVAYKNFLGVKHNVNAKIIQKHVRGWLARRAYKDEVQKIVKVQSCVRRLLAKKQLKALKAEARSIGHYKKLNVKLEKRAFEMQLKNKEMTAEKTSLMQDTKHALEELTDIRTQLTIQTRYKVNAETEAKQTSEELRILKDDFTQLKDEMAKIGQQNEDVGTLKERIRELEAEVKEAREDAETDKIHSLERYTELQRSMTKDIKSEREHHQKMLIENSNLQKQLKELQTIAELKEVASTPEAVVVNGGDKVYPIDDNERRRLEEIIVENVQLKEDIDRMTDELMEAVDDQSEIRQKYEQMELRLSTVRDILLKDISNTRNPRQAQEKIKSHLDQLRVSLFSDASKLNKHSILSKEDAALQIKVESKVEENIKLLADINKLQKAMPFRDGTPTHPEKKLNRRESGVKQRKQEVRGMYSCNRDDDTKLVKKLITQLKTELVTGPGCTPGLVGHVMFMCVRYADHCNDEGRIQELLTAMITGITTVTRKQSKDSVISVFWLANCLTLLQDLTQFSGEELYNTRLSPGMREFSLKNYDLSDYRNLVSDQCVNVFHAIVKLAQEKIQPMLIPGMLERDSIPGMNSGFSGVRRQGNLGYDTTMIVAQLQFYLQLMTSVSVSNHVIRQFISQILYFINASLMNTLLLRKDLCHWSKGIQIRYNLSQVEQWVRERGLDLDEKGILTSLAEIRQASQLLQMNKSTLENAAVICETCHSLNSHQLQKLLNLYSPSSDFEERVPQSVIKFITDQRPIQPGVNLMMDPNKINPLNFSYEPRDIDFTMINIPAGLKIDFVEKY